MGGDAFIVEFDQAQVRDTLARFARLGRHPTPLLERLGEALVASTQRRFQSNTAPDGTPWAPLNPAYAAIRRFPDKPILVQSGDLRNSIHFDAGARSVRVGSSMIYAGVHQFGAVIRPVRAKALAFHLGIGGGIVKVKSVRIPARPYLGISAADEVEILEQCELVMRELIDV